MVPGWLNADIIPLVLTSIADNSGPIIHFTGRVHAPFPLANGALPTRGANNTGGGGWLTDKTPRESRSPSSFSLRFALFFLSPLSFSVYRDVRTDIGGGIIRAVEEEIFSGREWVEKRITRGRSGGGNSEKGMNKIHPGALSARSSATAEIAAGGCEWGCQRHQACIVKRQCHGN